MISLLLLLATWNLVNTGSISTRSPQLDALFSDTDNVSEQPTEAATEAPPKKEVIIQPILCRCSADYCSQKDVCVSNVGKCFSKTQANEVEGKEILEVIGQGCFTKGIEYDYFQDTLCDPDLTSDFRCCNESMCNDVYYLEIEPTQYQTQTNVLLTRPHKVVEPPDIPGSLTESSLTYPLYVVGILVFIIAMVLGGMLVMRFCKTEKEKLLVSSSIITPYPPHHYQRTPIQDMTTSCSSGSGNPRLMEKTLIREITFCERIGKGRYGEVWRGKWRAAGEVAIKVFSNREEASWWHEAEMYQNYWLRHENILSFIGADQKDCVANMQYYLVLNFHPRGSLYDYLQQIEQLTVQESVRMCLSLSSGLDYLHTDIKSSVAKPSIAHRDLKSKNILVKNNGQCCIADFGLAVRSDFYENLPNKKQFHFQVGTRRYMAPEILSSTINLNHFDSLRKADMYMFGLVLWEIADRVGGKACPYQYPFQHDVPCDPTVEEMSAVVVAKKKRPVLAAHWSSDHSMLELSRIAQESWHHIPDTRLTCLRVKKDLMKLIDSLAKLRDSGCYFTDTSDQGFISWD